jgi:beta-glucoside operon transcriptional antiterminator
MDLPLLDDGCVVTYPLWPDEGHSGLSGKEAAATMRVKRVFNNNVVLSIDGQGRDVVLLGRGLGFQTRPGDAIREELVERRFVPQDTSVERLAAFAAEIPYEVIEVVEGCLDRAKEILGSNITDHLLVPLSDHVHFAIQRAKNGVKIEYPLIWEVENLYPAEVEVARILHSRLSEQLGVQLQHGEIVPLALHFVNAQLGTNDMDAAMRMTSGLAAAFEIIGEEHGIQLEEESASVARFVTHMRHLFFRKRSGGEQLSLSTDIAAAVRDSRPHEYTTARRISQRLFELFEWNVEEEEVLYMALHITRLTAENAEYKGTKR